jgi:hypothetical protein
MIRRFLAGLALLLMAGFGAGHAFAENAEIPLASGGALAYDRYPATGRRLLLWFASERGLTPAEIRAARDLAARGIEVWQIDLVSALFLPQVSRSLDGIQPDDVATVYKTARATEKKIIVYATGRAAVPVLKGLADQRACALLMHPNLYSRADALDGAAYLSFDELGKVDVLVLQPRRSAATPWIAEQLAALAANGARVSLRMLENLREGFWRREDATAFELEQGGRLADLMMEWIGAGWCFQD